MSIHGRVAVLFICCFAALMPVARLEGQAVYGSIVGSVVDQSGAPMIGVKITIRNPERDTSNETTTNESGNYTQGHLIAGTYQIRVETPGFQTALQDGVIVQVDGEARSDFKMQVGELSQTVEVTSQSPMLKTERSDVATTFKPKAGG